MIVFFIKVKMRDENKDISLKGGNSIITSR